MADSSPVASLAPSKDCRARFPNAPLGSFRERSLHCDGRKSKIKITTPHEMRLVMTKGAESVAKATHYEYHLI
ncbi:MAG: hypothetical protein ACLPSL_00010 [Smithella sp.]